MYRKYFLCLLCLLSLLALTACNIPGYTQVPPPKLLLDTVSTVVAQTLTAAAITFPFTPTPPPPLVITATPEPQAPQPPAPTPSPTPTQPGLTATVTPPPTLTPGQPTSPPACDQAQFVADVSVPDNTRILPGQQFTKTWRLRNTGACTWTRDYKLVFVSGDRMNGPSPINLLAQVHSGQSLDLSVKLKAPTPPRTYQGYWMLQNAAGRNFGIGANAASAFWVKIIVPGTPTPTRTLMPTQTLTPMPTLTLVPTATQITFNVTSVNVSITAPANPGYDPVGDPLACSGSHLFTASATIHVNREGTVTYRWIIDYNGTATTTPPQLVIFTSAGNQPVTPHNFTVPIPSIPGNTVTGSATLFVILPNNAGFGPATFSVACNVPPL